ncbi:ABC transporter permease [Sinorhizobium meliloti]|uniref:ABC transporter permease n=1 Tax=Rhizobium meliloti TaxID=382 RepID=UPI000B4A01AB|nr:ABC transporter permease [Sinorhizobium meliloti]ASP52402.1 ABC transporter permease [Sinorhizobium meliloti]
MSEANVTMAASTPQAALGRKLVAAAANSRELSVILAALAMFVALSLSTDTFFTELNLLNLLRQISVIGILAVGSTFIFISGEIDLSVGALLGLLAMICAALAIKMEGNIYGAALVVVALGAILSGINGVITTKLRIPSFITTLGMLSIYSGATLVLSKGMPISGVQNDLFRSLVAGRLFGVVPAQVIWMVAAGIFGTYLLLFTRFGYNVFATGGNKNAAKAVGINTDRVKILAFVVSGIMVGVTSFILVGWFRGVDPQTGNGLELSVIAAVIIGGTGLFGGQGSVLGTLVGALIIGMISNGTVLLGVDSYYEPVAHGTVILLAVIIDIWVRRQR